MPAADDIAAGLERAASLVDEGRLDDALALYTRLGEQAPEHPEPWLMRGAILGETGRLDDAIRCLRRTLDLDPEQPEAWSILGHLYRHGGHTDAAIDCYGHAARLAGDDAGAWATLADLQRIAGRRAEAIDAYRRVTGIDPGQIAAWVNLGILLDLEGAGDEAISVLRHAIGLDDGFAHAHFALASALRDRGRLDEALECYERTLAIDPDYVQARCCLLMDLNYSTRHTPEQVFRRHVSLGKRFGAPAARAPARGPARRRLRIGYVSPDFRAHSVAFFIEPVLEHHDRAAFEVFAYADNPRDDAVTQRLRQACEHWRPIAGQPDDAVAAQIRADRIDLLIDLAGHSAHNRMTLFARRPAPVQASWLGYPNTTGLPAMDFRLTDPWADPPGVTDRWHTETLVRLPRTLSCYRPPADAPAPAAPPSLSGRPVTFGSFNNFVKINDDVIALWARILADTPGARLMLKARMLREPGVRRQLADAFARHGIDPGRLSLRGPDTSAAAHMGRYHDIDIALDTFPYNGATTTADALWMGVPVVTLAGRAHAGRVGVSLLSNLGLTGLIGDTPDDYAAIATGLAADARRLRDLRDGLRGRMAASPLMDEPGFTRDLEAAFREMAGTGA